MWGLKNAIVITFACPFAAEATRPPDEDSRLVFQDDLTGGFFLGLDNYGDGSGLALVEDLEDAVPIPVS